MRTHILLQSSLASLSVVMAACGGTSRPAAGTTPVRRVAAWDTAAARRMCVSPDSVIAGLKDCVLLDQGRRGTEARRPTPPRE